jgi:hypothetical protein
MHDGKGTKLHLAGAQFRPLLAITVSSPLLLSVGPPHKPPRRQSSTSLVDPYARTKSEKPAPRRLPCLRLPMLCLRR